MLASGEKNAYTASMDKNTALRMLGGIKAAADAIGISTQAILQWPNPLPPRIADRVQAALWRQSIQRKRTETA
jgi:hypothetical protein